MGLRSSQNGGLFYFFFGGGGYQLVFEDGIDFVAQCAARLSPPLAAGALPNFTVLRKELLCNLFCLYTFLSANKFAPKV